MISIIDYEIGNTLSVKNAVEKLGYNCKITNKKDDISNSDSIILPGVGSFHKGISNLKKLNLIEILNEEVIVKKKKILGICLGFQLMCKNSNEFGLNNGLEWLDLKVRKINNKSLRLPHVGWNRINLIKNNSSFFHNINNNQMFYFNHTYAIKNYKLDDLSDLMTCDYGEKFIAAIKIDNIFGIQPHPEKSQRQGLQIIKNFIES
jgi:glutamine amidotransferase